MNQTTLGQIKDKMIEQVADNFFVSHFHSLKGNDDVSTSLLKEAIGVMNFARDQFGFDPKEIHSLATEIYNERKTTLETSKVVL